MIFTCTNFTGHWPVPRAAVIVADDPRHAKQLLLAELKRIGLEQSESEAEKITIEKINSKEAAAHILSDGNY